MMSNRSSALGRRLAEVPLPAADAEALAAIAAKPTPADDISNSRLDTSRFRGGTGAGSWFVSRFSVFMETSELTLHGEQYFARRRRRTREARQAAIQQVVLVQPVELSE